MGALERRDWAAAEADARARLARDPDDDARVALIDALVAQGRFEEALAIDAQLERPSAHALFLRGLSLLETGRPAEADSALAGCLQRASEADDPEGLLSAARVVKSLGQGPLARALAQHALVLNPTSPVALTLLGQLSLGFDDELARRRLEQSLALDADQPTALVSLAWLHLRAGGVVQARAAAQRALEIAPQWTEAQLVFRTASVEDRTRGQWLTLGLLGVGCAVAATGFAHLGDWTTVIPRVLTAVALFAAAIAVDLWSRRARRAALTRMDPSLGALEARWGAGSSAPIAAPSTAAATGKASSLLLGCAGFFGLIGLGLVGAVVWYLQRFPFHPTMLLVSLPFAVAALLWWESRTLRVDAEKARRDRS